MYIKIYLVRHQKGLIIQSLNGSNNDAIKKKSHFVSFVTSRFSSDHNGGEEISKEL